MDRTLNELKDAIIQADSSRVDTLVGQVKGKADFDAIFSACINPALNTLCMHIKNQQSAIPELLMSLRQVHRITDAVMEPDKNARKRTIVMGVIEGDTHDMGKNIIRDVCKGYGYDVLDLGKNVSAGDFAEAAISRNADIACLSTMLSTTIDSMADTVRNLKLSRPEIRVLIGGAFMSNDIAFQVGADGYAESAATVMAEIERVIQ